MLGGGQSRICREENQGYVGKGRISRIFREEEIPGYVRRRKIKDI